MADLGNLHFGVHLKDYTDAEADKIKKKLENLNVKLNIDASSTKVSNTDAIKQQIEAAVKGINVDSVKVDANAVRQQIEAAVKGSTPQVSVSLLKGTLASDLQTYLNSKVFTVGITITRGNAQSAVTTAFANVSVPVNVTVSATAALQQLRQSLANTKVKVDFEAKNPTDVIKNLQTQLTGKKVKIDVEADKQALIQSVKQALQGVSVKANVNVSVDAQAITRAVQNAINNANFTYNPNGGRSNPNSATRANNNLANSYRNAAGAANQFARASVTLSNGLHTNIRLGGQLGSVLGNFASAFGIKDILRDVVRIGGELENQRIALGAILQDGGKATEMFSRIQSLAVKSPFGVMDLNKYVKQLSAYQVPYNELYDTMKRLADISAGVGVDMGRIILAFGQVKAAGFLKGTELRQFTEANIPMVQALADRFSVLEKRIVSAAEVYDMISKKKVTFEDVKSVLWNLTDEGGMFNNMQEVLSESLASKWKNLADAVDVMFGKLADSSIGDGLKGVAELLTEITKGWEYVAVAIGSAASSFLVYKAAVVLGSKQMASTKSLYTSFMADKRVEANNLRIARTYRELTKAEQELIRTTNQLTVADVKRLARAKLLNKEEALRLINLRKLDGATLAYVRRLYGITDAQMRTAQSSTWFKRALINIGNGFRALGVAIKGFLASMWPMLAITAIAEGIAYVVNRNKELKEITKEVEESASGSMQAIGKELDKLKNIDLGKLNDSQIKIQLKDLTTLIKNEAPYWQGILADVFKQDADGNFVHTAKEQLEQLIEKIGEVQEAKQRLADNPDIVSNIVSGTWSLAEFGDIGDFMMKYQESLDEAEKKLEGLTKDYKHVDEAIKAVVAGNVDLTNSLSGKSIQQQILYLKEEAPHLIALIRKELDKTAPDASFFIKSYQDALNYLEKSAPFSNLKGAVSFASDNVWDELLKYGVKQGDELDNTAQQVVMDVGERLIKHAQISKPKAIDKFWELYLRSFGLIKKDFSVVPEDAFGNNEPEYDASKDEVAKLWKKRAEEIDKAVVAYDKWKKVEGSGKAEQRIKGMDEFANLFNGKYGFNLGLEDPTSAYKYIQSKLNKNLSAQNEVYISLGVKLSDAELKDAEDKLKLFLDETKRQIKETSEQWNLYKQLFEATGDKDFAMTAFDNTQVWDKAALQMKSKLESAMKDLGLDFDADFDIKDKDAKLLYGELYDSWKEIKDRIEKNGIDLKVNAGQAIESTQSLSDKIKSVENKRDEELLKATSLYGEDSKEYKAIQEQYTDELNKLKGELLEVSPEFKALFVDTVGMASTKIKELYEKARSLVNLINQNTAGKDYDKEGNIVGRTYEEDGQSKYIVEETFEKLQKRTGGLRKATEKTTTVFDRLWGAITGKDKLGEGEKRGTFDGIVEDITEITQEAANAAQSISSMFDALGDEATADAFALGGNILSGISNIGQGIASGNPFAVLSGVTGIIGSIAQAHDKNLDRAIQKSQLEVTKLTNAYSQLETVIDRQLGSITAKQSKEMLANLNKQRDELYKQYDLEDEKKKTDKAKLEDYKNQIAELDDQIEHFYEDLASEQYGADISGWAEQIAEALTNAFASGEDAAKAFDNTVGSILKDLATEAIKLQFIEPAMSSLKNYLFGASGIFTNNSEKGTDLSANEAVQLQRELEKLKSQIAASNDYWDKINDATGGLLETTDESAKDGLSKGIQSVTEDTANLLASYINAIRQNVSVNSSLFERIATEDIPQMSIIAQAQLTSLNNIAANTLRNADAADRIYELFNRVVDKGGNKLKI